MSEQAKYSGDHNLQQTFHIQKSLRKTGELFVDEGLITPAHVEQVLLIQKRQFHFFGNICCSLNMISPLDNYRVLNKYQRLINMETYLCTTGAVQPDSITRCNTKAIENNIPFLSALMQEQLLPRQTLARILFDLYHVPLRSVHEFVFHHRERSRFTGLISGQASLENGVLPLAIRDRTVTCGVLSPESLLFIDSLNDRFPLYQFEPCFIPLAGFHLFYKPVYQDVGRTSSSLVLSESDLKRKYSVVITNPSAEREIIQSLYEKYELFWALAGYESKEDRHLAFIAFIREQYARIREEFQCSQVSFSIETQDGQPIITAMPYL